MRIVRRRIDPARAIRAGRQIAQTLETLPELGSARAVGLYRPVPGEPSISSLEAGLRTAGKTLLLPCWFVASTRYGWAVWPEGGPLEKGPLGVEQPTGAEPADLEPDLALVPGLAFDPRGRRLGHGGGHFDRLLAAGHSVRVGVAFSQQIVERVPAGPADVAMHLIATENGLLRTGRPMPTEDRAHAFHQT